ncbi:MAG: hypothetical protein JST19_04105 [Bacteroidetes bacterium]|nr:hypothetical protein [Bacteroidota bacterium]
MPADIVIPQSVTSVPCMICGAQPIIVRIEDGNYIVKCPNSDEHYHTTPGLIDVEAWNRHNTPSESDHIPPIAC